MKERLIECIKNENKAISSDIQIADVNLYFNNSDVLEKLAERAKAINSNNWDQVKQFNQELTDLVKKEKDKLQTPVGAFVTLSDEQSYNALEARRSIRVEGEKCRINRAPEPTNIIWQNIGYDSVRRRSKYIAVGVSMFLFFLLAYFVIKVVAGKQKELLGKYYNEVPCDLFKSFYGETKMQTMAADSFALSQQPGFKGKVHPNLQCFCMAQQAANPLDITLEFSQITYPTSTGEMVATCSEIFVDRLEAQVYGYVLSGIMFVINMLLLLNCS